MLIMIVSLTNVILATLTTPCQALLRVSQLQSLRTFSSSSSSSSDYYYYDYYRTEIAMMERFDKFLMENIFGNDDDSNSNNNNDHRLEATVDPKEVLARFPQLAVGSDEYIAVAQFSLYSYLQRWGRLLEAGDEFYTKSLTTRVICTTFNPEADEHDEHDDGNITTAKNIAGIKLKFQPPKRYLSYKEQKAMEKGVMPDRKGAKVDAWSPGGIEILIQNIVEEQKSDADTITLGLLVRRCDIDGDTIIKFKSERTLVRRLDEAIRVWKRIRRDRHNEQLEPVQ